MPRTGLTPQEIREKATLAAEASIRKFGYERFRLGDIAKELGVAHTSLYAHFPDKAALIDEVSKRWTLSLEADLAKIAYAEGSPVSLLEQWYLTLHTAKHSRVKKDIELFRAYDSAAEMRKPFIAEHVTTLGAQVLHLVSRALAAGEIREGPPDEIVQILTEATRAFVHPRLVLDFLNADRRELFRQLLLVVLRGLAP